MPTNVEGGTSIEELLRQLAAITKDVRLSGTPEEARAFDYIGGELAGWGYQVNRYEVDAYTGYPDRHSLTIVAPERIELPTNSYALTPPTSDDGITGDIVDVGNGSTAEIEAADVRGKIILADGLPSPRQTIDAARAGAIGQIHVNGERIYELCISPIWGTPTPETAHLLPSIPAVAITTESGNIIREALTRGAVTVNIVSQPYLGWSKIPVLTADLPGNEEDTYVLFSGHVDSWHYGVMDNGTANATQMEVARLIAQRKGELRRGLRLAFWSGHSHSRYAGSAWYADEFFDDLATRCVVHVNVDSVGANGAIILDEPPLSAETFAFAGEILKEKLGLDLEYKRISRSSDQSFWGHGIPSLLAAFSEQAIDDSPVGRALAILLGGGGGKAGGLGWWWHTPEDLIDKIDPDFLKRDADVYLAVIGELLTRERLPVDPAAGITELAGALAAHDAAAGGALDLSDLLARARALAERASADRIAALPAAKANRLVSDLCRIVIPVNYTYSGPYEQDLALGTVPVPGLRDASRLATLDPESSEYRFLRTKLVRERNRISGALRAVDGRLAAAGL